MTLEQFYTKREKLIKKANNCARALADYMIEEHDPFFKEFDEALNQKLLRKYKAYTKALKALYDKEIEK